MAVSQSYAFGRNVQAARAGLVPPVELLIVVHELVAPLKFSESKVKPSAFPPLASSC
jgi:hypothetical protein